MRAVIPLLVIASACASQPYADQGITSELHRQRIGGMVFATAPIEKGAEDPAKLVDKFVLGEPIYGRFYLRQSAQNENRGRGGPITLGGNSFEFHFIVAVGGKRLGETRSRLANEWTTYKFSLTRGEADDYDWQELSWFLQEIAPKLAVGTHSITIAVALLDSRFQEQPPVAIGAFTLVVPDDRDSRIAAGLQREAARGEAAKAAAVAERQKRIDDGFVWVGITYDGKDCQRVDYHWYDPGSGREGTSASGWMRPGTIIKKCVESVPAPGCQGACTTETCTTHYQVTKEPVEQQVRGDCL